MPARKSKKKSVGRLTKLREKELEKRRYVTAYGRDLREVDAMMKFSCVQTVLAMNLFCSSKAVEPSFRFLMVKSTAGELQENGIDKSVEEVTCIFRVKRQNYIRSFISRKEVVGQWYNLLLESAYDNWETNYMKKINSPSEHESYASIEASALPLALQERFPILAGGCWNLWEEATPKEIVFSAEKPQDTFEMLFRKHPNGGFNPTKEGDMIFHMIRFRKIMQELGEEDPVKYASTDLSPIENTKDVVKAVVEGAGERLKFVFPYLCQNLPNSLAAAANTAHDSFDNFHLMRRDLLRITRGSAQPDGEASGLNGISRMFSTYTKDEEKRALKNFLFDQPECAICFEPSRMPQFCPNSACGGWVCHVCLELSGSELPVEQMHPSETFADSKLLTDLFGEFEDEVEINGYVTTDETILGRDAVTVMACPICCTGKYQFYDRSHGSIVGVVGERVVLGSVLPLRIIGRAD